MLIALPLYHVAALLSQGMIAVHFGFKAILVINPRDIPALVKDFEIHKPTLFTEGCNDRHEEKGKFDLGKWEHGERYAHSMINDFRNWVCGWIDWNIVLDQTGGPNHVGNFCDSPVIVDTEKGEVRYASSFYYIGHFSRFVHPGARRIESHGGPAGLESVAFANPDGGLAVVVLNTGDAPADFQLAAGGGSRPCRIPARAIQTYVSTP